VGIVGVRRGEGRSTLVLHLARVLADDGRQVMVVDADLRSPSLGRMLRAESPGGLVEVLTGEAKVDDVLQRDTPVNAMLLTAAANGEPLPPNTEVLFRGPRCEGLMEELSRLADIVLFDTAPLLDYPDTLELLPHLDAVIFVTQAGSASEEDVQQGLDLIRATEPEKLLGVVLNKVTK
jgi:Mrp family chromosome partitioning ATPase